MCCIAYYDRSDNIGVCCPSGSVICTNPITNKKECCSSGSSCFDAPSSPSYCCPSTQESCETASGTECCDPYVDCLDLYTPSGATGQKECCDASLECPLLDFAGIAKVCCTNPLNCVHPALADGTPSILISDYTCCADSSLCRTSLTGQIICCLSGQSCKPVGSVGSGQATCCPADRVCLTSAAGQICCPIGEKCYPGIGGGYAYCHP
jgi:hypothetical protein